MGIVCDGDEAGDEIVRIVWLEIAGTEVEGAVEDVEEEGVSVKLGWLGDESRIVGCECEHGFDAGERGGAMGVLDG